jgi:hypothetical protein
VKFDVPETSYLTSYLIFGVVGGEVKRWTIDGEYLFNSPFDLFMKPKENAIWVNVYKDIDGRLYVGRGSFYSEVGAKSEGVGGV